MSVEEIADAVIEYGPYSYMAIALAVFLLVAFAHVTQSED